MTTTNDCAEYVRKLTEAALGPGGPLYIQLSDLVSEAMGVAMLAAGLDGDDPGAEWPMDGKQLEADIAHVIGEAMFAAAIEEQADRVAVTAT